MHAVSAAGNELDCDRSLTAQETLAKSETISFVTVVCQCFKEKFGLNSLISCTLHSTYTQSFLV